MIADLHQHCREPGAGHLPQRGGGPGGHPIWQRVDLPQIFGDQLRATLSAAAARIVKRNDSPGRTLRLPIVDGVGVQRQIKVVIAAVGLPDGGSGGAVRVIATVADAAGVEIRLHGVRNFVHPVFLAAAAGHVWVPVLCRRA